MLGQLAPPGEVPPPGCVIVTVNAAGPTELPVELLTRPSTMACGPTQTTLMLAVTSSGSPAWTLEPASKASGAATAVAARALVMSRRMESLPSGARTVDNLLGPGGLTSTSSP